MNLDKDMKVICLTMWLTMLTVCIHPIINRCSLNLRPLINRPT